MYLTPYALQAIIQPVMISKSKVCMAKKHKDLSVRPANGNHSALAEATTLTTLQGLRKRAGPTQEDLAAGLGVGQRTEGRRDGKEGVRTVSPRWSPYHYIN